MLKALRSSRIPRQAARGAAPRRRWLCCCAVLAGLMAFGPVAAMQSMSDEQMSGVNGAGLAFGFDDFRFQAAPTSYIEQVGGEPAVGTTFKRGDLRWNGVTMSNWRADETATQRTTWSGTCDDGFANMGCPISTEGIGVNGGGGYATHDNPFVLRVFEYQRVGLNAAGTDWVGDPVSGGTSVGGINRTVLDLLGPSDSQNWRWAFWGEAQSSDTDGFGNIVAGTEQVLRNQNLILGKPAAFSRPRSVVGSAGNPVSGATLQVFQYRGERVDGSGTTILDETMGLLYHHRLSGDYRFSLNQTVASGDTDPVPQFSNQEGLYFTDVNAYLPLGQLYYQAVVLDSVKPAGGGAGDGNFIIELTRIPNDLQVYQDFYSVAGAIADPVAGYNRNGRNDRYYQTHGYVEWGDYFPTCATGGSNCMAGAGTDNGIRFSGPGYDSTNPETITLPDRVVNASNFPGGLCDSDDDGQCAYYTGNIALSVTVPLSSGDVTSLHTRQEVAEAPGISFVSRSPSSTWWVKNNQNSDFLERDEAILRWRSREVSRPDPCGGVLQPDCEYGLDVSDPNPPDPGTAPAVLTGQSPHVEVNAINLGTARVQGLLVNHLRIKSLGAAN